MYKLQQVLFGGLFTNHARYFNYLYKYSKNYLSDKGPMDWRQAHSRDTSQQPNNAVARTNYFAQVTGGFVAGAVMSLVRNPMDVVKTRMQTQSRADMHQEGGTYYKNIFSGLNEVVRTEGFRALLKGVVPKIMVFAPMSGLSGLLYEYVMKSSRKT